MIASYIRLTKPNIILMVVVTGVAAMAAEGSLFSKPLQMTLVGIAILLSAASANAFNQIWERDIDSSMSRTKSRRPLPRGDLTPFQAIVFAFVVGVLGNVYLFWYVNPLSAFISVATLLFYVLFYTAWLKPRHYYNIVIGGAAGATAPLIAWAAATGSVSIYAWILFAIIFTWTPPHFWALAIAVKEDYVNVKMPMLPVVLGEARTRLEIVIYSVALFPLGALPYFLGYASMAYFVATTLLWVAYMLETVRMLRHKTSQAAKRLFLFSILYIFVLFFAVAVDGAVRYFWA